MNRITNNLLGEMNQKLIKAGETKTMKNLIIIKVIGEIKIKLKVKVLVKEVQIMERLVMDGVTRIINKTEISKATATRIGIAKSLIKNQTNARTIGRNLINHFKMIEADQEIITIKVLLKSILYQIKTNHSTISTITKSLIKTTNLVTKNLKVIVDGRIMLVQLGESK